MFLYIFQIAVFLCAMKITHLKYQKLRTVFLYDSLVKEIVLLFPHTPDKGNRSHQFVHGILQYSLLFSYTLHSLLLIVP